ncbi:GTP-binding protein REM 2 isoform X7 [Homo sapiens]|uniref:GTP-binding protein REM 2 isoform X7 n=1 Tax=Homo sapiens TaxID=9606 RepID=UPI001FB08789|nr:GTP-binding protein REM 2 isoform X7 [Homo sapiens]XP_054231478.1 GTP-binding protein REM 2 isoform X7 [Homo sapiens]
MSTPVQASGDFSVRGQARHSQFLLGNGHQVGVAGPLILEQPGLSLLHMVEHIPLIASFSLPSHFILEADATLLKKSEKLLAELDRSGLPSAPGAPRRRGSMPVPYKHQLRRAQAVDELDWPPQASSSGSSDSLGSGEAAPAQKDGIFKVMLVGESGVGKSTLAGTFGGLQGDSAHEPENPEDTYERRIMVDKEEVTLVVYDIWEQGDAGGWLRDHCLQTGDAFLIVFSVTDRRSFSKVPETLLRLRAGRPHHDLPVILVGNKSDLARSRERAATWPGR